MWRTLLREVVGAYQGTRYGTTTLARLEALTNRLTVERDAEALVLRGDRFLPQGDDLFVNPETGERLSFEVVAGRFQTLFPGPNPRQASLRMAWHERGPTQAAVALAAIATLLAGAVAAPAAARLRRRHRTATPGRWWAMTATAAFAAFGAGFVAIMADPMAIAFQAGPGLLAVLTAGLVALAASGVAAVHAVRAWRGGLGTTAGRVGLTAVALEGLTLSGPLAGWNLLGCRL